jgi:hypothetical protein
MLTLCIVHSTLRDATHHTPTVIRNDTQDSTYLIFADHFGDHVVLN